MIQERNLGIKKGFEGVYTIVCFAERISKTRTWYKIEILGDLYQRGKKDFK